MANSGLPGTSGFVGEFMVILASFQQHPLLAFAAATTLITGGFSPISWPRPGPLIFARRSMVGRY